MKVYFKSLLTTAFLFLASNSSFYGQSIPLSAQDIESWEDSNTTVPYVNLDIKPNSFYYGVGDWPDIKEIQLANEAHDKKVLSKLIKSYFDSLNEKEIIVGYKFVQRYDESSSLSQNLYFYSERSNINNSYPIREGGWMYERFSDRDRPYEYLHYLEDKISIKYDTIELIKSKVKPTMEGFYDWLNN